MGVNKGLWDKIVGVINGYLCNRNKKRVFLQPGIMRLLHRCVSAGIAAPRGGAEGEARLRAAPS